MERKKLPTTLSAVIAAVAVLLSGTFAWQSTNQTALNEASDIVNPGGRLHDDFDGRNKDIYVENFADEPIFARIQLGEFLALTHNKGVTGAERETILVGGTDESGQRTYEPHIFGANNVSDTYWTWTTGGSTVYMPTFNKNKDSLAADINGTSTASFADYVDYTQLENAKKEGWAIYDNDEDDDDELTGVDLSAIIAGTRDITDYKDSIRTSKETHAVAETIKGTVITMDEWLDPNYKDQEPGNYWVWDDDGWAYWAAPILPQTATGLLLDQVARTEKIIESTEWYYGINVVAQFITADSLGSEDDQTGFFDTSKGSAPTNEAMMLLSAIGVDTSGENHPAPIMLETEAVEVSDAYELRLALESGSEQITLTDDIELEEPLVVSEDAYVYLNGCSITPSGDFDGRALFTVTDGAWLDFDERGIVQAPADGYAVWVEDGLLYIWDGTFIGGTGAVYVRNGEAVIVDGTFYLQGDEGQLLDWRSGDGEITVYRGTFYNFDPSHVNGESLLEDGYTVEVESYNGDTIYTVTADTYEPLPEESVLPDEELPELPVEDENGGFTGDELPEDGTEGEDTSDDVPGVTEDETGGTSAEIPGTSTDVPEIPAPSVPDSSVIESTETGALSGISGKADVVEPETPAEDSAESGPPERSDAADDTAETVTDEETAA